MSKVNRRKYSQDLKFKIVLEVLSGKKPVAERPTFCRCWMMPVRPFWVGPWYCPSGPGSGLYGEPLGGSASFEK